MQVSNPIKRQSARDPSIDAFRGIAVLSVALYHYTSRWMPPEHPRNVYGYAAPNSHLFSLGFLGVEPFFVISGIVITMTVMRSSSALDFAIRRVARILPPYIAAMIITAILAQLLPWPRELAFSWKTFGENLVMPLLPFQSDFVDGVYWSLGVEIEFYVIVAVGVMLSRDWFWAIVAFVCVLTSVAVHLTDHFGRESIDPYAPFFLFGMATWFCVKELKGKSARDLQRNRLAAAVLALSGLSLVAIDAPIWIAGKYISMETAGIYLSVTIGLLTVTFAMGSLRPAILNFVLNAFAWVGRPSYSIYLIHQAIGVALIAILVRAGIGDTWAPLLVLAGVIIAGRIMWRKIEEPGDKRLKRWLRAIFEKPDDTSSPVRAVGAPDGS